MQVFRGLDEVPGGFGPSAVTIGKFDGVHAGHRAVLAELDAVARDRGLESTVVTFDRNPLSLLAPERCPDDLASVAKKIELLDREGVEATLVLAFDRALSEQPPEEFVSTVLVDALAARVVLVGADFRFGFRGTGTVELLVKLGAELGFEVKLIGEFTIGESTADEPTVGGAPSRRVSSTWIRELLEAGDVAGATVPLGRLHSIRSGVVHGEQRGRVLGYPTANLSPDIEGFIPRDGVYAAWATARGVRYGAAVSIGNNPTFEGVPQRQVEAHLLDQSLDLYGETIELEFVDYVRPMRKFDSADALAGQMRADEVRIREILGVASRA